jgi:hypothetical protein
VVAGLFQRTHPAIHAADLQAFGQLGAEQEVVDAQPGVALPVLAEIVSESEDFFVRVQRA